MPTESYDEAYEADDEDYEADDEDDEAYEADDEADDEDDESYEADDEADDESYEADDEDDESYEADDEADDEALRDDIMRAQAASARARAQAFNSQRIIAQRAIADQRQLNQRILRIHGARAPRAKGLARVPGSAIVVAELPNGRKTRMRITPAPASAASVNRLRLQIAENDKRQAKATADNAKAIGSLTAAQAAAVKKLTEQQLKADKELTKRIVDGDSRLDKRINKELAGQKAAHDKHRRATMRALKNQQRRALWNSVLIASAMPFFAAYGDEADPFSRNNLILTGSLAGWLMGDEVIDAVVGRGRGGKRGRVWRQGTNLWSYLAPVGNALTVYYLLNDKQHTRFITGLEPSVGTSDLTVKLSDKIAEGYREKFNGFSNVRVVATVVEGSGTVVASVSGGDLKLRVVGGGASNKVAWIVDTQDPAAK